MLLSEANHIPIIPKKYICKDIHQLKLLSELFQHNTTFIDIGAGTGFYTLFSASRNIYTYSFEPLSCNYGILVENVVCRKMELLVDFHMNSLGNSCKSIKLDVFNNNDKSMDCIVSEVNDENKQNKIIYSQTSKCITLDKFFDTEKLSLTSKYIIKIDVPYYDLQILEGMKNLLSKSTNTYLLITIYDSPCKLVEILTEYGFDYLPISCKDCLMSVTKRIPHFCLQSKNPTIFAYKQLTHPINFCIDTSEHLNTWLKSIVTKMNDITHEDFLKIIGLDYDKYKDILLDIIDDKCVDDRLDIDIFYSQVFYLKLQIDEEYKKYSYNSVNYIPRILIDIYFKNNPVQTYTKNQFFITDIIPKLRNKLHPDICCNLTETEPHVLYITIVRDKWSKLGNIDWDNFNNYARELIDKTFNTPNYLHNICVKCI